eukprot:556849-Prymnesium_polylepis.1
MPARCARVAGAAHAAAEAGAHPPSVAHLFALGELHLDAERLADADRVGHRHQHHAPLVCVRARLAGPDARISSRRRDQ